MKPFIYLLFLSLSISAWAQEVKKELLPLYENSGGILLTGQKKDFEIASHLLGMTPPTSWPKDSIGCETLLCALGKQYKSEKTAQLVLEMAKKHGLYLSLGQEQNEAKIEKAWSYEEALLIDEILSERPETFKDNSHFKYFYRTGGELGRHGNVPAIAYPNYSRGYIVVSDLAFSGPDDLGAAKTVRQWSKITLFHEMCHQYDFKGRFNRGENKNSSEKQSYGFYQFSWLRTETDSESKMSYTHDLDDKDCLIKDIKEDIIVCSGEDNYIAPKKLLPFSFFTHRRLAKYNKAGDFPTWYANDSVAEDFAESCAHYRYAPYVFKDIKTLPLLDKRFGGKGYQNRYEFLKNEVFAGQEY